MTFKLFNYMTTQINGKDPKQQERKQELKYVLQKYIFQIIIWNVNLWNKAINSKYHSVNLKLYQTANWVWGKVNTSKQYPGSKSTHSQKGKIFKF